MAQQTAVEWLIEDLIERHLIKEDDYVKTFIHKSFEQAKAMEKLQIINAFKTGEYNSVGYFNPEYPHQECSEQYYNETYGK